jgi:hypothetical protein
MADEWSVPMHGLGGKGVGTLTPRNFHARKGKKPVF